MSVEHVPQVVEPGSAEAKDLLACLEKIGKGLVAAGISVGVVENTITELALIYGMECEIVALPNVILMQLGPSMEGRVGLAAQSLTTLPLDQTSELSEIIDQVRHATIPLREASQRIDSMLARPRRFHPVVVVLGYGLSCVGLTLLYRPDPRALIVTGTLGILVGLMMLWVRKRPRFDLLLPVIVATVVSTVVFTLTRLELIFGPANLLITPLVIFLPGSLLTVGMIELASKHILSGSARLIYGAAVLILLFTGISIGLVISGLPRVLVSAYEAVYFPWWAPLLGTLLFGLGTFIRLSGANRDLFWMLLVLYIAMIGQSIGELFSTSYVGAFIGAALMALSSELIGRSPRRTPAVASQTLAFWFLVPGARGLLSVTTLLSESLQSAAVGLAEMLVLIVAITLGVLFGTLITSPHKFVPISADPKRMAKILQGRK
jgi:uncharacterized membrane protein YjjP (DUF1212 family)